jgi:hypothetical protein
METLLNRHWHGLETGEVARLLSTSAEAGHDDFEVRRRPSGSEPRRPARTGVLTSGRFAAIVMILR